MKAKYKLSKWTTISKPRNGKVIINKKNVMQKLVKKLKRLCRQSKRPLRSSFTHTITLVVNLDWLYGEEAIT